MTETDLRTRLHTGATDDQLAAAWHGAVAAKLPGHGINDPVPAPARAMPPIGG
jgi:GTP 3',8-cyclase